MFSTINKSKKGKLSRTLALILAVAIMICVNIPVIADNSPIRVFVGAKLVQFDVQPQLIGGRTMVPLRAIFEALGATVSWDAQKQEVTAYNEQYLVKTTIGSNTMTINGNPRQIDIAPMIVDGRTLVPARFVAEAFDCDVQWDGETKSVYITTKPIDYDKVEQGSGNTTSQYYPGTDILTFTSITGIPVKKLDYLNSGKTVYMYSCSDADTIIRYWDALKNSGWELIGQDDSSTEDVLESGFYRGKSLLVFNVYFDFGEVWLVPSKIQ